LQVREVNSGAARRKAGERLMEAARRREIDLVLVWRLDRWGRSVTDLLATLQELEHLGVGFVSLTEALDLTTPAGCAMAGLLAIFAEFERHLAGADQGRPGASGERGNGWVGRRPRPYMLRKSSNCTVLTSASPRSRAAYRWAEPRCAESCPLIPPSNSP
jgi:DNA invertase Pin-like site-specific DNA recombinase